MYPIYTHSSVLVSLMPPVAPVQRIPPVFPPSIPRTLRPAAAAAATRTFVSARQVCVVSADDDTDDTAALGSPVPAGFGGSRFAPRPPQPTYRWR